ncbi:DUF4355 domain-containing protein [Eupransor demetentiae]|uniref:DUF4355 domain-containing protein n=1 Tax=Eupransor demetentiae TaxID=3109584 RepID=A0ABM9N4P5_9LACO|nr:hypothetical protein R54876_GBNLAHCA_00684 [Lactobacillaceae bacterium LMG 33000]
MTDEAKNENVQGGGNDGLQEGQGQEDQVTTYTAEEAQKMAEQEAERRVAKVRAKWEKEQQAKLDEAKSEGAKLAKMSEDEKRQAEQEKQEAEYKKRLDELNRRELTANTRDVLSEKGLPSDLADSLVTLGDAEAINKTVDVLTSTIEKQVNAKVDAKLSGSGKPNGSASELDNVDNPFAAKMKKYQ